MTRVLRECRDLLASLVLGAVLVPGLFWLWSEYPFELANFSTGRLVPHYLDFFASLDRPIPWLWLLTPYFIYLLRRALRANQSPREEPRSLAAAASGGHTDMVRQLIDHGADVDARDRSGQTPLHLAASQDQSEIVRLLLDGGADIDAPELQHGYRPLHLAASSGSVAVTELLVRRGADLDALTHHGETALHLAAAKGYTGVIELLLKYRAKLEIRNTDGLTALEYAEKCGQDEAVEFIKHHVNSEWPFMMLVNG